MIEVDARQAILNDPTCAQLLSDRVYVQQLPQNAFPAGAPNRPAITFTRIAGLPTYSMDGATGLSWVRLSFTMWAEKYLDLGPLRAALVNVMYRLQGHAASRPANFVILDRDLPMEADRQPPIFKRVIDFRCAVSE